MMMAWPIVMVMVWSKDGLAKGDGLSDDDDLVDGDGDDWWSMADGR